MKCPHCLVTVHIKTRVQVLGEDSEACWQVVHAPCPACGRFVIQLQAGRYFEKDDRTGALLRVQYVDRTIEAWPRSTGRNPVPSDVPKPIAEEYTEACLVLLDSPKASAALGRRCLQHVLRGAAKVKPSALAAEIQQVLDSGKLPSVLADSIDAVRIIGNFSAHPIKSTSSGEIVDVEPHEAEWTLDVLEGLFDYYYVQPAMSAKRREALNKKL